MQDNSGLRRFLSVSWVYELFQNLAGSHRARKWIAATYWRLDGNEKVVDIGCGPGVVLDYLPRSITYVGFDISEEYVAAARRRFGKRATFIVSTARELLDTPDERLNYSDLVLCNGLLHHLDDKDATDVLELTKRILAPIGRMVCVEPTFLAKQGRISRWILGRDRGRNIRTEQNWKELVKRVFNSFSTSITTGLTRIPYTHIIIECRKDADISQ